MQIPPYSIFWSARAEIHYENIKNYLLETFSSKEVSKLNLMLQKFETTISLFPKMYPVSKEKPSLRRAVLNKQLSVIYSIRKEEIQILALLDNRQDVSDKLKK